MSEDFVQLKFEAFLKEANRLGLYGWFLPENRYKDWSNRVMIFLNEIADDATAQGFWDASVEDPNNLEGPFSWAEFNVKKRFLSGIYESYQIQKNLSSRQKNDSGDQRPQDPSEDQNESDLDEEKSENKEINVFIVHGHDNNIKEKVARFVEKLGFRAIILHEQPNRGKTIIEKFESFAEKVNFTIVLLTPDDIGASVLNKNSPKYRARQNVIFEFGFFAAKLGRAKVCALCKGDIEIPSDYSGVVYLPLDDNEAWKMSLVREMKNAGLAIDPNKLF